MGIILAITLICEKKIQNLAFNTKNTTLLIINVFFLFVIELLHEQNISEIDILVSLVVQRHIAF